MENGLKVHFKNLYGPQIELAARMFLESDGLPIEHILALEKHRVDMLVPCLSTHKPRYASWNYDGYVSVEEFPTAEYSAIVQELISEYRIKNLLERQMGVVGDLIGGVIHAGAEEGRQKQKSIPAPAPESSVDSSYPWWFYGSAIVAGVAVVAGVYFFSNRKA